MIVIAGRTLCTFTDNFLYSEYSMHIHCSLPLQQIQRTFTANCQYSKYVPHLLLIAISVNTVCAFTANFLDSDTVCTLTPNIHDRYTVCTFTAYCHYSKYSVHISYCHYSKSSVHIRYTGCTFTAYCHCSKYNVCNCCSLPLQ